MQPKYLMCPSSVANVSQWLFLDRDISPFNLTLVLVSSAAGVANSVQVDCIADDPTGTYKNPAPFLSSATPYTVFASSLLAGNGVSYSSASNIGQITQPIAALRLNVATPSSQAFVANLVLTVLQAGFKQ